MDIHGTYRFEAPPEVVWDLLMDTEKVAHCIPGCDRLEPIGEDRYKARLTVALAAVTGTYDGTVAIADRDAPRSYRLLVEGQGRPGFVKGDSRIALAPDGAGTVVTVEGRAQVGGPIARVGQRLMASVGKTMLDRFFGCLQASVKSAS